MKNQKKGFLINSIMNNKLIILVILVWIFMIYMLYNSYIDEKKTYLNAELDSFNSKIEATLKTYELFSNYIYDQSINEDDILKLFLEAKRASDEKRDILRNEMYQKLIESYEDMIKYNFRQLHFHFSNGDSFLRFHRPEKYGDNLLDVRETIKIANEKNKYVFGFEEGRIYNGYRFVYPLNYREEHIGSVEVSISMATLMQVLTDLYPGMDLHFVLEKNVVGQKVFDAEQSNYIESIYSRDYLVDKAVQAVSNKQNKKLTFEETKVLIGSVKSELEKKMSMNDNFTLDTSYLGQTFLIQFLTIKNVKYEPVGYFIAITSNKQIDEIKDDSIKEMILVTAIVLSFIISYTILIKSHNKLKKSSSHDFLTKIYNRHKFLEIATSEMERFDRYGEKFSVVMVDIDYFKVVNDTYGHGTGDKVLIELTQQIKRIIRVSDVFARWGGEEFICLLPNTELEQALIVSEKIRAEIEKHEFQSVGNITISLGVAEVSPEVSIEKLIESADEALYRAKNNGRNRVEV